MRLDTGGSAIDIDARIRAEFAQLPPRVRLLGNAMQRALALALLERHAPNAALADDGETVECMSLEAWASLHLAALLEGAPPPACRALFRTIPEAALVEMARRRGIPVVLEARDGTRALLERIAAKHPQAFLALARSAERLRPQFDALRDSSGT